MGGKKGKERKRDIKGKEVRQPLGNHPATNWQPRTLGLISRDRIGPLATVAKSPWKWYDFLPIPGPAKLQKKKAQE